MSSNISSRGESSSNDKLFLSFWNVCLSNFPVGLIKHTVLTTADAQVIVNKAYEGANEAKIPLANSSEINKH